MANGDSAIRRFNHLLGELDAVYHDLSFRLGMSDSVSKILYTICDAGVSCPLHLICQRTGLSKQTVNSALRKLEREGLVYLQAAGARSKTVCLTQEGDRFCDGTARQILRMENQVLDAWSQEEVQQYLGLTERFLPELREKAQSV